MTALEIIQTLIIWGIIGTWVAWKRNWYTNYPNDQPFIVALAIVFMPINLIIALGREFIAREWTYHK